MTQFAIGLVALLLITVLPAYVNFHILEAIHRMREGVKRNPGGYYQTLSIAQRFAAWHLRNEFEISVDKLPQGGYNVHPYNWKRTLRFQEDKYNEL